MVNWANRRQSVQNHSSLADFALVLSLCAFVLYYLFSFFVGAELPSIVGSLIGLLIVGVSAKKGFLVPKKKLIYLKIVSSLLHVL